LADAERLSLYDEVRARGYEASIIATYTFNFDFYERVVLRRLQSSGCRHNILLADAAQCAKALASRDSHPNLCGAEYTLLPIKSASAFHPKFIMLLGRKKARLIVGSHNVTISGFGLNREIATAADLRSDETGAAAARKVWEFVRAWTGGFSREIQNVISATERIAPWLAATNAAAAQPRILCTLPSGPSLWDQLKQLMPQKINRLFIISPHFDSKLAFVGMLERELRLKECLIAVHRQFTNIPPNAESLVARCRFLDITHLGKGWNNLHAKVYGFELGNGKILVVSGSANASDPAWLAPPSRRNAEIVVVHDNGDQIWKRLGLTRLSDLPDIDEEGWQEIRLRTTQPEQDAMSHEIPFVATRAPEGFLVSKGFTEGVRADRIRVLAKGDESTCSVERIEVSGEQSLCVCGNADVRESATRLEAVRPNRPPRFALVHHVDHLLDKAAGTLRQAFRRAFSGLEGDPEQLTELLKVVEKAIFDEPISVDDAREVRKAKLGQHRTKRQSVAEPTSLMISAKHTAHARRHQRRIFASSDLALIIDALIYRLGRGLHEETEGPASVRPSDVDFRDETQEAPPPAPIDGHALAKLCRAKMNRLFRRMTGQLELALKRGKDATTPVVQLAAVLGVVKHLPLRQSNFEWLPHGEKLIDPEQQCQFFKDAARLLYAPDCRLAAMALAENDQHEFDELTAVRGLLSWVALDCGVDARSALNRALDAPDLARENLVRLAYFLPVISQCASDKLATTMLTSVADEQKGDNPERAAYHLQWAQHLVKVAMKHRPIPSDVELGDVAVPLKLKEVPISIVVDVQPNKSGLLDLNTGEPRYFASGYLARIQGLQLRSASR